MLYRERVPGSGQALVCGVGMLQDKCLEKSVACRYILFKNAYNYISLKVRSLCAAVQKFVLNF